MNHFTSHKFQFIGKFIIFILKIQTSNDHRYPLYRNKFDNVQHENIR
jgi:hypothetical protein